MVIEQPATCCDERGNWVCIVAQRLGEMLLSDCQSLMIYLLHGFQETDHLMNQFYSYPGPKSKTYWLDVPPLTAELEPAKVAASGCCAKDGEWVVHSLTVRNS